MGFFGQAIEKLKVLVIALGAGLGVWGIINLLEGYGADFIRVKNHRESNSSWQAAVLCSSG